MIESKMTDLARFDNQELSVSSRHPISFQSDNKIFYWNPGLAVVDNQQLIDDKLKNCKELEENRESILCWLLR
jgi:hypothetical protein